MTSPFGNFNKPRYFYNKWPLNWRPTVCFIIALILKCVSVNAQNDYLINPTNLDPQFLCRLIKNEQDSLRKKLKHVPLVNHARLQFLAQKAAEQNLEFKKLKKTPKRKSLRAELTDLGFTLELEGELSVITYLEEPINYFAPLELFTFRNQTYKQAARNIVAMLKTQAAHSRMISDPRDLQMGIGMAIDTLTNMLAVVQYFTAGLPEQTAFYKEFSEKESFQAYAKSPKPWFKRAPHTNRNLRLAQKWTSKKSAFEGWITTSKKDLKRAFRWYHPRSGLVLEVNSESQFEKKNAYLATPSRNNQQAIVNGTIGTLIKRKEIISEWKKQAKPQPLKILGLTTPLKRWPRYSSIKLPGTNQQQRSAQVLVIRRGKLCNILGVYPIPASELDPPFSRLPFLVPSVGFQMDSLATNFSDSSAFQVYYLPAVTQLHEDDQQALLGLVPTGAQIKKIRIHAFASIEGNAIDNEKLFKKRAANIQMFLEQQNLASSKTQMELFTEENWKQMREQLATDTTLLPLTNSPESKIREYINKHVGDSLIRSWLDAQRYAWISFELNWPERKPESIESVLSQFEEILNQPKQNTTSLNKLAFLQRKYYGLLVVNQQALSDKLTFPPDVIFSLLRYQKAVFQYKQQALLESKFLAELIALASTKGLSATVRQYCVQHHQVYLANAMFHDLSLLPKEEDWNCPWEKNKSLNLIEPKKHKHAYSNLPSLVEALDVLPILIQRYQPYKIYRETIRSLDFYYLVTLAQALLRQDKFNYLPTVKGLATKIWNQHVMPYTHTEKESIEFALFFNLTNQRSYSIKLLQPLVMRAHPNPDALMIWISLNFNSRNELKTENALLEARKYLTINQWCELVGSGNYIPLNFLERFKVRKAWYEACKSLELY